jgi:hypothetical protein
MSIIDTPGERHRVVARKSSMAGLLSMRGRLNRARYLWTVVVISVVMYFVAAALEWGTRVYQRTKAGHYRIPAGV